MISDPLLPYPFLQKGNTSLMFIHIPKTAGTSLHQALGCYPIDKSLGMKKHYSAREIISLVGEDHWNQSYKIAFVRNPWDRVYSYFRFRLRHKKVLNTELQNSFKAWIYHELVQGNDRRKKRPNLRPQRDWLIDHGGGIQIDFIGQFHRLLADYEILKEKIGLVASLKKLEKGNFKGDLLQVYDQEMQDWVSEYYKDDIVEWGFQFQ